MQPPNLEAELAAALGRQCEVTSHELARAMDNDGKMSVGLKRAIINALTEKDPRYQLKIIRKNVGRPLDASRRSESARQVSEFVAMLVSQGNPQKAAVSDACIEFRCSRATVYSRMREWRQTTETRLAAQKFRGQILNNPKKNGQFKTPNKRAKRKNTPLSASKYFKHAKNRESERQKRSGRLS